MRKLRDILYEYANTRGGGLPLTAEEVCNAVTIWVQQYVTEYLSVRGGDSYIQVANDNGTHIITLDLDSMNNYIRNTITEFVNEELDEYISLESGDNYISVNRFNDFNYELNFNPNAVRVLIQDTVTAYFLSDKIKGSESIIVDIAEDGQTLEVHIDSEVMQKIERAILIPVSPVTENSVPVVTPTNEVNYTPVSELGGGGGGTKLYQHEFKSSTMQIPLYIVSTSPTPVANVSSLLYIPNVFSVKRINTNYLQTIIQSSFTAIKLYLINNATIQEDIIEFGSETIIDRVVEL